MADETNPEVVTTPEVDNLIWMHNPKTKGVKGVRRNALSVWAKRGWVEGHGDIIPGIPDVPEEPKQAREEDYAHLVAAANVTVTPAAPVAVVDAPVAVEDVPVVVEDAPVAEDVPASSARGRK